MLINNPLEMNDWHFPKFVKVVILMQILMLLSLFLSINSIIVPVITPLIGFVYLSFVPGYLILRILRLHHLGSVKSLLYGVGLSLFVLMFTGYFMNICLPLFGVKTPLTLVNLSICFTAIVLVLCLLSFLRDGKFHSDKSDSYIDIGKLYNPSFLFLCLLPFLAVFGSYLMNLYSNNILTFILLVLIVFVLFLVVYDGIPEKFYIFAVWVVSISLLYSSSLISSMVWGWDVQNEFYLANLVLNYSVWNFSLPDAYNALLSIVMVAPVYSLFTQVDLDHVFKLVYPFIFSLMPLGLYKIFRSQVDSSKLAFLAVFLFVSFNTFFIELVTISREMTAEFFMVLLLLLILERKYKPSFVALLTIFSVCLVVSHYSLTYFFLICILGVTFLMLVYNISKFGLSRKTLGFNSSNHLGLLIFLTLFMVSVAYLWYGINAQGFALKSITDVLGVVFLNVTQIIGHYLGGSGDILSFALFAIFALVVVGLVGVLYLFVKLERQLESYEDKITKFAVWLDYRIVVCVSVVVFIILTLTVGPFKTWIVSVLRYMNFVVVFFTIMGFFFFFIEMKVKKFQFKYLAFAVMAFIMLIAGFLLPSFRAAFNMTRIYEITFLVLALFCVYGGIKVFESFAQGFSQHKLGDSVPMKLFTVFLAIFLIFNAGLASVVSDTSVPMSLSNGNLASDYYPLFNTAEASSAQWLSENKVSNSIYADVYGRFIFNRYLFSLDEIALENGVTDFTSYDPTNSYIYQRKLDINNYYLTGYTGMNDRNRVYLNMSVIVYPKSTVFDDGDSKVHYS
ncbi:MAG: DUF2206 domain-containing protein [Methanobacterium sp. ERen5]|nr:MAG: DUF2206 domain-containing protein [Methanobacterium sp. ERen5]